MTSDDKQKFSDHTRQLWKTGSIMKDAHQKSVKSVKTFKNRFAAGQYDFAERNLKLSETISKKYVDGTWKFCKGMHLSTKTGKSCYYRSSWERILMEQLDTDESVVDWESEFTAIQYMFNGTPHKYIPDFHVVRITGHSLIEVKPLALRFTERNSVKRSAALEYCQERGWEYTEWCPEVS